MFQKGTCAILLQFIGFIDINNIISYYRILGVEFPYPLDIPSISDSYNKKDSPVKLLIRIENGESEEFDSSFAFFKIN